MSEGNARQRWLASYARWIRQNAATLVAVWILFAGACAWFATGRLALDANTDSLIGSDRPFMTGYRAFIDEFGDLEYIYVAVDSRGDRETAHRAVNELAPLIRALPSIREVHATISDDEQWRLAAWTMTPAELASLGSASPAFPAFANGRATTGRQVATHAIALLARIMRDGESLNPAQRDALAASVSFEVDALVGDPHDANWTWAPRPTEYLATESGTMFLLEVLPEKDFSSFATIEQSLAQIREAITKVAAANPSIEIGLTGKPVLQADELATSNDDMTRGAVVATVLIALLTIWVLRSVAPALLATLALGVAFAWTYGAAALLVGRLNLLSLVFMLVLVSAGIDYGIHLIARYREFRERMGAEPALRRAVESNTIPIWTGALTSAVVFFAALLTEFSGLAELGTIAGVGLLICAAAMTSFLPATILLHERWMAHRRTRTALPLTTLAASNRTLMARAFDLSARWTIVAGAIGVLAVAALIPSLDFESNLLKLQAEGLPSVEWEQRLLRDSASASWFGAIVAHDEHELAGIVSRAKAEPDIESVRSVLDFVPEDSPERATQRRALGVSIMGATMEPSEPGAITPELSGELATNFRRFQSHASQGATEREGARLTHLADRLEALDAALHDPQRAPEAAARTDAAVARVAIALGAIGKGAVGTLRDALPSAVSARLVAPSGQLLASLIPRDDIWEFAPLTRFVAAIRRVSADATGVPITVYESVLDMKHAFILMSTASLLAVAVIVWIDFRSLVATATCVLTLVIGLAWTLGAMSLLGIPLNLANFFGVPMLLGFGIDATVHLMHRARETGSARALGWTSRAVLISAATTAIGFGTLLFASHQGLRSLGWLIVIGTVATSVASVWLLPALLRRFPRLLGRH